MGSIPFLLIQVVAVGVIIAFPGLVTHYKGNHPQVDPASIQINVPMPGRRQSVWQCSGPIRRAFACRRATARPILRFSCAKLRAGC